MKPRKILLIISGIVAVCMVVVVVLCYALLGFTNPIQIRSSTKEIPVVKDFVSGEDTVSEVTVDNRSGLKTKNKEVAGDSSAYITDDVQVIKNIDNTTTTSTAGTAAKNKKAYVLDDIAFSEIYQPGENLSKPIAEKSVLNTGNRVRLANKMRAFMNGGDFTIGYIGGSVTEGFNAEPKDTNGYAALTTEWFSGAFPRASFTTVNAGVASTGSYLGVHRVDEQLLAKNPDIVFIEFAVNDEIGDETAMQAYESIVRKVWNSANAPAIVLLVTTCRQSDGTFRNNQAANLLTAQFYDLPIISFADSVDYAVNTVLVDWTKLLTEDDGVHPTNSGHQLISQLIGYYMHNTLAQIVADNSAFTGAESDFSSTQLGGIFDNAKLIHAKALTNLVQSNFTDGTENHFGETLNGNAGAVLEFDFSGKALGLQYQRTLTDGQFRVYVDGNLADTCVINGETEYPYGKQIYTGADGTHHVKIEVVSGSLQFYGALVS